MKSPQKVEEFFYFGKMPKKSFFKKLIKKEKIEIVDFRFVDLLGKWHHFSIPQEKFDEKIFKEGIGFDGSSIKGFKEIEESDMLLLPDPESFFIDPFLEKKTLVFICDVYEPGKEKKPFLLDPRFVAKKAEEFLKKTGIADKIFLGPEIEFFIFDKISFEVKQWRAFYEINSSEAWWETQKETYSILPKEGYSLCPPQDKFQNIRSEIASNLKKVGIKVEKHHHEVATAGQGEVDIKYDTLLAQADNLMKFKYVVKQTAFLFGKTATFMPKPIFGDNGSGMHLHISLWKKGKPLFYDKNGYANLSKIALYFIGGLFKHIDAVMSFCAPTVNSYKRLVPGYEAPVSLFYFKNNRSAAIRVPVYSEKPEEKRIEFRPPDPSCNPYLAFSAVLMAGIDGIRKKIDPGKPLERNILALSEEERKRIKTLPASLEEALEGLEKDKEFLKEGNVFSEKLLSKWITLKREEIKEINTRPHPYEFLLYHNC